MYTFSTLWALGGTIPHFWSQVADWPCTASHELKTLKNRDRVCDSLSHQAHLRSTECRYWFNWLPGPGEARKARRGLGVESLWFHMHQVGLRLLVSNSSYRRTQKNELTTTQTSFIKWSLPSNYTMISWSHMGKFSYTFSVLSHWCICMILYKHHAVLIFATV